MTTSEYPNYLLLWRILRYLMVRLVLGTLKLGWWLVVQSCLVFVGVLRLIASPASSGRAHDEFKDLVQADSPETHIPRVAEADGFWRMYLQAYSPRLWRMRRLLPMSAGKDLREGENERDH